MSQRRVASICSLLCKKGVQTLKQRRNRRTTPPFIVLSSLVCLLIAAASAQSEESTFRSYYLPGNLAISLRTGVSPAIAVAVDMHPAVELLLAKIRPGDLFPIDIGIAARALLRWQLPDASGRGISTYGIGPFVTAHLALGGGSFPGAALIGRFDLHTAIGVDYQIHVLSGDWSGIASPPAGFGLAISGGINFFVTESLALQLGGSYHPRGSTVGIGLAYRLGEPEFTLTRAAESTGAVGSNQTVMAESRRSSFDAVRPGDRVGAEFAYLNFTALYQASLGFDGFDPNDESFGEGDGVRWRLRFPDNEDVNELVYTRALLRINTDGSKWWRFEFSVDGEETPFDCLIDRAEGLAELRYFDRAMSRVSGYIPQDPDTWRPAGEQPTVARAELESSAAGNEQTRVEAGTFAARRTSLEQSGQTTTLWFSTGVPGWVVKLAVEEDGRITAKGELVEIVGGYRSPWGDPW